MAGFKNLDSLIRRLDALGGNSTEVLERGILRYRQDWVGMPAQPFLYPAIKQNQDKIIGDVANELRIWHNRSTGALAAQVDQSMNAIGFRRAFAADVPDPAGVKHKTTRYRGIVDKDSKLVYQ